MNKRSRLLLGLSFAPMALTINGCTRSLAASPANLPLQTATDLVVYKDDFAMVHEQRAVDLTKGPNNLQVADVSSLLDPKSVIFEWAGAQEEPQVTSTQYELGTSGGNALLKRFVGDKVELAWASESGTEGQRLKGTLEAVTDEGPIIKTEDRLYVNPKGTIILPNRQDTVLRPELSVAVDSPNAQKATMGVSYLTRGASWSADYVLKLAEGDEAAQMECWATITNRTSTQFRSANLTLIAGSPNRAVEPQAEKPLLNGFARAKDIEAYAAYHRKAREEAPTAVGELYRYKIATPANISPDQLNRVVIFSKPLHLMRDYNVRLANANDWYYEDSKPMHQSATVAVRFKNDTASPMPAGTVRAYESGTYVGASDFGDTPVAAPVDLTFGTAFDVYVDAMKTSMKVVKRHAIERSFEVKVTNEKKSQVSVRVVQPFYGPCEIQSSSIKPRKLDSQTYEWTVSVPAGQSEVLRYTLRTRV